MENRYFAIFYFVEGDWMVRFPDAPSVQTYDKTIEKAHVMAVDVLSALLVTGRKGREYSDPSSYEEVAAQAKKGELVFPVVATEEAMKEYRPKKRVNVMVPVDLLEKIDAHVKEQGGTRSKFICEAVEEAL